MGITASDTTALAARYGADEATEQVNLKAPTMREGGPIKTLKEPGYVGFVNPTAGGLGSTGFVADNGTLNEGDSSDVTQVSYYAKHLANRLRLPRGALEQLSRRDGVKMAMVQLKKAAGDHARQRAQAFYNNLGSPAATVTASSTTFTTANPSGFRVGQKIDVYTSAGTFRQTVEITKNAWAAGTGNTTITFTPANVAQWETTDVLYLRGQQANGIVSVSDIHADANLYSLDKETYDWSGNLDSSTTTLSETAMRDLFDLCEVRSGKTPDCVIMASQTRSTYMELFNADLRFVQGQSKDFDHYNFRPMFDGVPVEAGPEVPKSFVYFHCEESVQLHEFRAYGPVSDGDQARSGMAAAIPSQTSFSWDIQMHSSLETRVERRNSSALMNAITNS